MWTKIVMIVVGSVLASKALRAWKQHRQNEARHSGLQEHHAVNRWEDDGGLVPVPSSAASPTDGAGPVRAARRETTTS